MRTNTLAASIAGLLAAATAATPAHAQSAREEGGLEEITVTAQRREERLQSTPVAVTAFTPESLERLQIQETKQLAASVPNLLMYTGVASPSMVNLYMRGAGEQIGGLVTSESAVGVYLDDVYQARLGSANVDLVDIERIEVLRGPQGTLYGRNSMTGALKIYTRTPDGPTWGTVSAGVGSYDEYMLSAGFGGVVVPDTLGASISMQYRDRQNGWFYNRATDEKRGTRDVLSVRGKLALVGRENLKATLTAYYTDDENDGLTPVATDSVTLLSRTGGFRTTQSPTPSEGFDKQRGASLDVKWTVGGGTLRSITALGKTRNHFRFDLSGGVPDGSGGFVALVDRSSFYDTKQFSQELQWLGQGFGRKLDYILGAFYFDEDANQTIADTIFFTPIRPEIIGQESKSYAAFSQATWHFTDALSGTLGLRYTKDRKHLDGSIATFFGAPTSTAVNRKDEWSVVTPKAGIDWQVNDDVLVYGSVAKGYRAGGYNGLTVANPAVFNTPFDPELVWAYEVGTKTEWFDRTLRLNVAAFYNDIQDIQQSTTLGGGATVIQNVGKVAVYGAELEVTLAPIAGLEIFGHLTTQKDDYKELNASAVAATVPNAKLVHTPHVDSQLGFSYRWSLGAAGAVRVGADASHKGTYFSDATNAPITKVSAYTLVNAFVGWENASGRLQATLNGRNLTDEEYYVIGLALIPPNGIRFANQPPTFMATVKYAF